MSQLKTRGRVVTAFALSLAILVSLSACGTETPPTDTSSVVPSLDISEQVTLRIGWSGSQDRTDRTLKAIDMFTTMYPNVTVNYETTTSTNYWDKLTTQVAGGNAPDIIQMSGQTLKQYVDNGVLDSIQPYVDNGLISLDGWEEPLLNAQTIKGVLYGVPPGVDAHAIILNATKLKELGIAIPETTWTWDDYAALCAEITQKSGSGYWGSEDGAPQYEVFQVFLAQRGKTLFTSDAKLGFTAQDLTDFWGRWGALQDAGVIVPPDIQQENGANPEGSGTVKGYAAMDWSTSSQFTNFQSLTSDELVMLTYTYANDGTPGQVWRAGLAWSIVHNSKHPQWAAALINFLVNDQNAALAQGTTRGVPGAPAVRPGVEAHATVTEQLVFENLTMIQGLQGSQITSVFPNGFLQWWGDFQRLYYSYVQKQTTLEESVSQLMIIGQQDISG